MRSRLLFVAILGFVYVCVSCGGGGGDGGGGGGFVDTNQKLAITDSNALAVTGLVVDAASGGITAGSLGSVITASLDSPHESGFEFNFLRVTRDVLELVREMRQQGTLVTADISPAQVPPLLDCSDGGTVTAIWTDSDPKGELSVHDYITLHFNVCIEDDLILNGELVVGVLDIVGDPFADPDWSAKFRLNFNSLTASDEGNILEVIGSLDATVDTEAPGDVLIEITTEVDTGGGTTASSQLYFGEGEDFTELTLFSASFQENADGSYVVFSKGTLESSFIGGTVTFETTLEVTGTDFDDNNPSAGEIFIVGAVNSNVLLRILDSVLIELDVDDEGDGFDNDDDTIPSSWDELNAAVDAL